MSAVAVQSIAAAALLDGAEHPELEQLASAGSYGVHPGNCHRDIMVRFAGDVKIADADHVGTFLRDPKTSNIVEQPVAVFLPHKMIHKLAAEYGQVTSSPIQQCSSSKAFWDKVEATGDPKLQGHPMTRIKGWKELFIPLWVHGDGVEFQSRDTLMVFSFGVLLNSMAAMDSSMLLGAVPKSCSLPCSPESPGTWSPLWRWITWSFIALFMGKFPTEDPDGQPCEKAGEWLTPQKYRFVVWVLEGDHEYFSNTLGLPHWNNHRMCWDCDCDVTSEGKHWRDLVGNSWIVKTIQEVRNDPPSSHYIFKLPGVTSKNIAHDALHVVFNHGILSHLLGSVLHVLCYDGPGVRNQAVPAQTRLALIWAKIQEYYVTNKTPTRLTNLKAKMFCDPDKVHANWPALNTKAGETKHLLPALLFVTRLLNDSSPLHTHMIEAMRFMLAIILVWDQADAVLTTEEAGKCMDLMGSFYREYNWLNIWASENERYLFHVVQKFHMFYHLVYNARFLNPRMSWCFKAEDYVGKISTLGSSVIYGVNTSKLSMKLAKKYRLHLHMRLTRPQ